MTKKIIIILGPTASGKSGVALKLAKKFNGYLISADSRQVYKEMDIATAKDNGKWVRKGLNKVYLVDGVEEYLVDAVSPRKNFTTANWLKKVKKIINKKSDQVPIIVGGTGLYISALVDNYSLKKQVSKSLRKKLEKRLDKFGLEGLVKELLELNPEAGDKVDLKNPRRVVRALEVLLSSEKEVKKTRSREVKSKYEFFQIGITRPREELYERINKRVDLMLAQGLLKEVQKLVKKYSWKLSSMSGIGYKQIGQFLRGEVDFKEAVRLLKRDTRHYAKKQLTWFKRDQRINWLKDYQEIESKVDRFLK